MNYDFYANDPWTIFHDGLQIVSFDQKLKAKDRRELSEYIISCMNDKRTPDPKTKWTFMPRQALGINGKKIIIFSSHLDDYYRASLIETFLHKLNKA